MERLGYYNGNYGPLEQMMVPMNDRVSWFGDGVYDAGPCRNYRIFALDEHVDRFFRSADKLKIVMPVTKDELKDLLNNLVKKMDTGNLFVYYQVTRGTGVRKHAFTEGAGNLWITLNPAEISDGHTPIQLVTMEDTRFFHCDIKTLNLIPSVMASQKAAENGCAEAVFYRTGGRVTECAHSNVHILKNGILYTAPTDNLILPGIARAHLLRACAALGIAYKEEAFSLDELFDADEVIVTSSSNLCLRADQIDGQVVGSRDSETYERLRDYLLNEFYQATAAEQEVLREAIPKQRYPRQGSYTIDDYLALPDDQRMELIDGVIYDMSAPTTPHQLIGGEIYALLREFLLRKNGACVPFIAPVDVQLDMDNKTMVQPDVCVVCDHSKINRTRIFGAPDFVVEVLSPSTKMKDILIKMKKYHSAGVREYWMVDPDAETVTRILYMPPTEDLPDGDMKMEIYPFSTPVPVGIFNDEFLIDFSEIRERYAFMFNE